MFTLSVIPGYGQARDVSLTLSTDRGTYFVGEPVWLRGTVRNEGSERSAGYFALAASEQRTFIFYSRQGSPRHRFRTRRLHEELMRFVPAFIRLDPGNAHISHVVMAYDPERQALVLDQPGQYDFQISCRCFRAEQTMLESNIVTVHVVDPPAGERGAFREYAQHELAQLAQFDS